MNEGEYLDKARTMARCSEAYGLPPIVFSFTRSQVQKQLLISVNFLISVIKVQ